VKLKALLNRYNMAPWYWPDATFEDAPAALEEAREGDAP